MKEERGRKWGLCQMLHGGQSTKWSERTHHAQSGAGRLADASLALRLIG